MDHEIDQSTAKATRTCPTSIQYPLNDMQYSLPSLATSGNTSFSILVGRGWIRFRISGEQQ